MLFNLNKRFLTIFKVFNKYLQNKKILISLTIKLIQFDKATIQVNNKKISIIF